MLTRMLDEIASLARLDFAPRHRRPPASRVLLSTVAAIAGSLAADAILVAIGDAIFPGTRGYVHFRFSDYAKLTVIGETANTVSRRRRTPAAPSASAHRTTRAPTLSAVMTAASEPSGARAAALKITAANGG
jgi:hypothetical protein